MLWRLPSRLVLPLRSAALRCLSAWRFLIIAFVDHRVQVKPSSPVRVYIASLHWNNEGIFRDSWNKALLDLVLALGPSNVFVSVYENGSRDGSKAALRELDNALNAVGASRNITLDKTTHADDIASPPLEPGNGWIKTPRGQIELRRIPYLARLRNISLQPLRDMAQHGTTFDYVLFLNDVVFTVADVLTLLNTNKGEYAAACSLDFSKPPSFYDTFALRDASGNEYASQMWPYFRSSTSRAAMKRSEPVPVTSCWNGMVFMPATSFVGENAIAFRGLDDKLAAQHLEGSECCLVHTDNPSSAIRGVYLNPNVRVGYNRLAYDQVNPTGSWLTYTQIFTGQWNNRLARWFTTPWFKEWRVRSLQSAWEKQNPGHKEEGSICVINEMQVLIENGWAHV
ncbi:cryptococcal mannosyltransferase 1-domain-containing protein [Ilyonectria robusta]|uniref:cryptococcal mannosyltransferase 1-domain-containing protein n=1 Tax=Ilyonectria robusta TaxID=1079257 RepID=UPI001E8D096A|nr:cryptococcal mannosyltransferase 1-domain-containing protein [Ilyonectria robusta]KAH8665475.1 cryptococcal mannosyltransferase 1-domain-containing protein [Ilyonectria robusta]